MDKFKLFVLYLCISGSYTEFTGLVRRQNVMRVEKGIYYEDIGNKFSQNRQKQRIEIRH